MKLLFRVSIVLGIVATGIFVACHKKPDYIGPAYISAPDGFAINSFTLTTTPASAATPPAINFSTAGAVVKYNASFTNAVSWKLTIVGQTSGAIHEVTGTSNGLTDVEWRGAMDGVLFFKIGEIAKATLSFYGTTLTQSLDLKITNVPKLNVCPGYYFAPGATFDSPSGTNPTTGWNGYNIKGNGDTGVFNVRQGVAVSAGSSNPNNQLQYDRNGNLVQANQGIGYYYIRGIGDQQVFVSGVGFGSYNAHTTFQGISHDPTQIWVNIYLYGSGDPNAGVQLEFQESADGQVDPNPSSDDIFVAYVTLSHTGWKLFSFRYSDLAASVNDNGKNGNKIHEPQKLWGYGIVVVKLTDPKAPIEVFADYPIITTGGPFKPCI